VVADELFTIHFIVVYTVYDGNGEYRNVGSKGRYVGS